MTIFDAESPLSDEEIVEVRQYARERIGLWRKRSLYSVVALLLSCASPLGAAGANDSSFLGAGPSLQHH
jgi:hypothetical protein